MIIYKLVKQEKMIEDWNISSVGYHLTSITVGYYLTPELACSKIENLEEYYWFVEEIEVMEE